MILEFSMMLVGCAALVALRVLRNHRLPEPEMPWLEAPTPWQAVPSRWPAAPDAALPGA